MSPGDPATLWPIATRVLLSDDAPRLAPADRFDGPEVGRPSIPFGATSMCVQHCTKPRGPLSGREADLVGFSALLYTVVIWATLLTEGIYRFGTDSRAGWNARSPREVVGAARRMPDDGPWPRLMASPSCDHDEDKPLWLLPCDATRHGLGCWARFDGLTTRTWLTMPVAWADGPATPTTSEMLGLIVGRATSG